MAFADAYTTLQLWSYVPYIVIGIAVAVAIGSFVFARRLDALERQLDRMEYWLYQRQQPPPPPPPV